VQRLANTLAFERRSIRSSFVVPLMPIKEYLIGRRGYPRGVFRPGMGPKFDVLSPVRLHLCALLARRIDALDASGYLRDATLPAGNSVMDSGIGKVEAAPFSVGVRFVCSWK
jgi:hypothetical protein